ncbi:MAG: M23 family metallopeptidase [Alcanivoracaceae bacterium]
MFSRIGRLLAGLSLFAASAALAEVPLALRGEPAPGSLMIGKTDPSARVLLGEQPLKVDSDGWFVFGFGRDDGGKHTLVVESGSERLERVLQLTPRDWSVQYIEGVPQETVTPPPERLARIRAEAALVREARATDSSLSFFRDTFSWPLAAPITGVYGSQRVYNGTPKRPHFGVDLAAPVGTPVYAPAGGKVTLAHPDMFYSGGTLLLDHGLGVSSTFIHLHRIHVKEGDMVAQGQLIGEVGKSGRATGAHLDWRINWFAERLDPQWFLGGTGLDVISEDMVVKQRKE